MSLLLNVEEGTARQLSAEHRNRTNSSCGNFQRDPHSVGEINGKRGPSELLRSGIEVAKGLLDHLKKTLDTHQSFGIWIFLILCVTAIFMDTLFLYIPVINGDKKCFTLDKTLGILAILFRSTIDFFYTIYLIFQWRSLLRRNTKGLLLFLVVDLFAIVPVVQVQLALIFVIPTRVVSTIHLATSFFLVQYLVRFIRISSFLVKSAITSSLLAKTTRTVFSVLLIYILASYILGGLWYLFAIERETQCWKQACKDHIAGCDLDALHCDNIFKDYKLLSDFCPTMTRNTTIYGIGISNEAIQSGILEVTDFPKKLFYCFRWGLQNLSSFGQNLQPSTHILENIVASCIVLIGVVIFSFIIGIMQAQISRLEENERKRREIKQWMPFQKLSEKLRRQVNQYQPNNWPEIRGVDMENFFNNLSRDLKRDVKRELCIELLKKVEEFGEWRTEILAELCDFLKPVFYTERTRIVREGDPIDEMLFVVQGRLRTYTSNGIKRGPPTTAPRNRRNNFLQDGDFWGRELVTWFEADPYSSELPISTKSIQAVTNVEAFALMADDLQNILVRYRAIHFIQSYWRFRKVWRAKKGNAQASADGINTANAIII